MHKTLPFTIKAPFLWETLAQTSFFLLSLSSHLEMLRVSVSRSHEATPETSLNKKGEPGLLCNHTALKAGVLTQLNNEWRDVGFEGASKGIEWGQKWSHASELSLSWSPWDLKKKKKGRPGFAVRNCRNNLKANFLLSSEGSSSRFLFILS